MRRSTACMSIDVDENEVAVIGYKEKIENKLESKNTTVPLCLIGHMSFV